MGQTAADEVNACVDGSFLFSWTLPGGKTKCFLASLHIYYQVLSRRQFVKEINELLSEKEQIRQDRRVGLSLSLSLSFSILAVFPGAPFPIIPIPPC